MDHQVPIEAATGKLWMDMQDAQWILLASSASECIEGLLEGA